MNNSYSLNKSPKIAKRLLVLLDMIVVVLTLALSVSALQRHFWTIGLWRPLASCLAHRPLHRHWFSFVAFPLNIATPEIGGWFVNAVQRQYEVKLASGGGAPLLQCGSSESVHCRPVSEASVSSSVSPVAAYTTGMKSASGLLRPPAATKRVSHVQTKQRQITRWWLTSQLNAYFHPVDHKVGQQGAAIDFLQLQNLFLLGGYTQTALRSEFILFLYIDSGDSWRCWYNR